MSGAPIRGRFLWYELLTPDPAAAVGFYAKVVGWGTAEWEGEDGTYTMWLNGESPIGGVMCLPDDARERGAPAHWLAYVGTPDVDGTVARAEELGGKTLVPPTDIPGVGRFAVLSDPQEAVFAVFDPSEEPDPEAPPGVGEFSWNELATTDPDGGFSFYAELFGREETDTMDLGPGGVYRMYGREERTLGGIFRKPPEMAGPPGWLYYIRVDDVARAVDWVKEMGGRVVSGPMEVPGGDWIAQCLDPQGAAFALHSTASA